LYNAALSKLTFSRNGWIDDGNFHYYYAPYGFAVDPDYEYMGEEIITHEGDEIGNILTTQWNQTYPYNNKLPFVTTNKRAYAGCTLIAIIQIMAYHKKPYGSVTAADWTRFTQSSQCYEDKLQDCILSIFNELEGKEVSVTGTSITIPVAQNFLHNNGYTTTHQFYNLSNIIFPAMIAGFNEIGGHAWVIDSKRIDRHVTYDFYEKDDGYDIWRIYIEKQQEYSPYYVHCNWGGGTSDGWYINNAFLTYTDLEMLNIQPQN
jgi:hypothetical protein